MFCFLLPEKSLKKPVIYVDSPLRQSRRQRGKKCVLCMFLLAFWDFEMWNVVVVVFAVKFDFGSDIYVCDVRIPFVLPFFFKRFLFSYRVFFFSFFNIYFSNWCVAKHSVWCGEAVMLLSLNLKSEMYNFFLGNAQQPVVVKSNSSLKH